MIILIAIGSDHGGYELKERIANYLIKKGMTVEDFGCFSSETSVDYPDYGLAVAEAVAGGKYEFGIIVCGTGIGISIAANKVPGIRAALCTDCYMARMSREHNNANILALGGRVIGEGLALEIVETWLNAKFAGERHQRRLDKITGIEEKNLK